LAALLTESVASADACLLAETTAAVAVRFVTDPATAGVSTMVMTLTQGVVKAMAMQKAKILAAVCLVLGLMSGGVGTLRYFAQETPAAEPPVNKAEDNSRKTAGKKIAETNGPTFTRDLEVPASPVGRSIADAADGKVGAPPSVLASPAVGGTRPLRTRIGLINMTRVLKSAKKMRAMQDEQREYIDQVQKKLDTLKTAYRNYLEAANHTTQPDEREKYEPKLRELKRQVEEEEISAKQHFSKQSAKATVRIYRDIEDAANRIAKAQDLELVMFYTDAVTEADFYTPENLQRKLSQSSALVPMIVAPGMDITETVIEALNRMHEASQGK
jgi:Skp family chaperone for outer membrane proteins